MKKKEEYWTTKDGSKIAIKNMKDAHLLNAHRFLMGQLIDLDNFQHNSCVFAPSEGTIAYDDFEKALEESYERYSVLYTQAETLGDEIKRRGLEALEPRVKVDRIKLKNIEYFEPGKIVEFEREKKNENNKYSI